MELRFTKGHGTENDFVLLLDEAGERRLTPGLVRFLCNRRAGIGADGVIRAVRGDRIAEGGGAQSWFMDYWNSDGTTSEMCGNGARVFAAMLERDARVSFAHGVVIGTRGGQRTITSLGDGRFAVSMGPWNIPAADAGADSQVEVSGLAARPGLSVELGNPHTVIALAEGAELAAADLTRAPVVTPPPANGTNVELVVPLGERVVNGERRGLLRMRVHERGSGETRSCGTGACAAALAVRAWGGADAPDVWDVLVPGGELTVRINATETVLEGPAVLVADGMVTVPNSAL